MVSFNACIPNKLRGSLSVFYPIEPDRLIYNRLANIKMEILCVPKMIDMRTDNLSSENFSTGKRNYFIDFKRATNNSHYICITRSDKQQDGGYRRSNVVVFEEDFHFLISAFSSLFHSAAHLDSQGESGIQHLSKTSTTVGNGIRSWSSVLRPREKFMAHGMQGVSNAELISMLIGSGSASRNAVAVSEDILKAAGGRLERIYAQDCKSLSTFEGIGIAKSCAILAALELGRRMCAAG